MKYSKSNILPLVRIEMGIKPAKPPVYYLLYMWMLLLISLRSPHSQQALQIRSLLIGQLMMIIYICQKGKLMDQLTELAFRKSALYKYVFNVKLVF